jgi:hypothetical protein
MARVFQAYGCRYAMLLDMNALEHTYLALYARQDGKIAVQHLILGMEEVDKSTNGAMVPIYRISTTAISSTSSGGRLIMTRRCAGRTVAIAVAGATLQRAPDEQNQLLFRQ